MSTQPSTAHAPGLVERAKNMLLQPRAEWDRIALEPAKAGALYFGYLTPLALIGSLALMVGLLTFAPIGFFIHFSPAAAVSLGVAQFVSALVTTFALAVVTNALAPNFDSQADADQATKLAVYSMTPWLVSGILFLLPGLADLTLLGAAYSLLLFYLGLPRLMKTSDDKRFVFTGAIVIAVIVIQLVLEIAMSSLRTSF